MTKTIFDINEAQMSEIKSTYTLTEIYQQPATWKKTCQQITELKDELKAFINQVTAQDDYDIILTGAGTSEFVGNTLSVSYTHLTLPTT